MRIVVSPPPSAERQIHRHGQNQNPQHPQHPSLTSGRRVPASPRRLIHLCDEGFAYGLRIVFFHVARWCVPYVERMRFSAPRTRIDPPPRSKSAKEGQADWDETHLAPDDGPESGV